MTLEESIYFYKGHKLNFNCWLRHKFILMPGGYLPRGLDEPKIPLSQTYLRSLWQTN
jgi:hypothetical protein